MYTQHDFKTKKAFKEAVAAGHAVTLFQPNNMFGTPDPVKGTFSVEGPHYPKPHTWYATVKVLDGKVYEVK